MTTSYKTKPCWQEKDLEAIYEDFISTIQQQQTRYQMSDECWLELRTLQIILIYVSQEISKLDSVYKSLKVLCYLLHHVLAPAVSTDYMLQTVSSFNPNM